MYLEIVTPEKNLYSGEVDLVQLPGSNGSFELMKNHAAIISSLVEGSVKVKVDGKDTFFDVKGGVVECHDNNVIILAEA